MFYNKKEHKLFGLNRIMYKSRDSTPSCNNMMIEEQIKEIELKKETEYGHK